VNGTLLIVGASRGIGLGLVDRHLVDGWEVHVTTRDGSAPRPGVSAHRLDVRDYEEIASLVGSVPVLDRVVHNAGINRGSREEVMAVNAVAPIAVVQALLDAGRLRPGGTVAIMTSQAGARRGRTGSLGDYGDSKAALNDEFWRRSGTWRLAGVTAVVIHPGWVRTDMGGPEAPLSVEESCDGIVRLLDRLAPEQHGHFLTWDGREHPW
jgi:NAD(P)-dependent dehydrogenase (short-subunit alcohol dehydrogenase family)